MDSDHLIHHLEDPANAIAPYPSFYEGPRLGIDLQTERTKHPYAGEQSRERYDDNCTLWVGNLDLRITETMLFELFSQVGDVKNITFPKQKQDDEKTTGFCFVNFLVPDSVPKAIDVMQGTVLFGRRLFLKCRPDSIHAMNKPNSYRTVKLVKKSCSPGGRPRHASQFSPDITKSSHSPGQNRVRELRGEGKFSENLNNSVSSSMGGVAGARYSPIRAPSPEGSSKLLKLRERKNLASEERSSTNDTPARRRVVIRSSSGSVVPVINIANSTEPKLSSVVVTPPQKVTSKPPQSVSQKSEEVEMTIEQATSTTATRSSRDLPPPADKLLVPNYSTNNSHNPVKAYDQPSNLGMNNAQASNEAYYPQNYDPSYQHYTNNYQQWRPPLYENMNPPPYPVASMGQQIQPVTPHYNRYVWFNGNSRYQNNNFHRFRSNFQPRQASFPYQAEFGNYNSAYPRPPRPMYNPRFSCFRPVYNNSHEFPPNNNMPFQHSLRQPLNHYDSTLRQDVYPQQPPRPRSRSRSRSSSRSNSPYRVRYRRDRSSDKFSRIDRSRSVSPSHPRRSISRESSYDRYHRSRRTSKSSGSDSDDYYLRKRQRRSRSYSSSIERRKGRDFRSVNSSRSSSVSRESDREKTAKLKEGLSSTATDTSETENDTAAVSSSSHKVGSTRKKLKVKSSHKNTSNMESIADKLGKSKTFRRSSRGSEAEEYDPSDPGY